MRQKQTRTGWPMRWLVASVIMSLLIFLTGCLPQAPMNPGSLKVTLLHDPGGRGDRAFNDMASNGADWAKAELGDRVNLQTFAVSNGGDNRELLLRLQGESKTNLVICASYTFTKPVQEVAKDFPETTFVVIDGYIPDLAADGNILCLRFREQEGSYLVGAAAAMQSTTGKVGFIGGADNDVIHKFEAGFVAGAHAINPAIAVYVDYIGPDVKAFQNPDRAEELALHQYDFGTDVIYTAAGGSGAGVIKAAEARKKLVIGVDSDQSMMVSPGQRPYILTSMIKRVDLGVYEIIKAALQGELKGGYMELGIPENGVGYAVNEYNQAKVGPMNRRLEAIQNDIVSGSIQVPDEPAGRRRSARGI
ncbi:BMP family ABC transporter substrate-binding protein [Heliobacterium chlorum]|uniref:BMP family ABC transporter substrate-binding protein n=1 Tax=Heliobacterium chlorum TaxID=2698 RepID=A0ABR7T5J0_HELCL|nr:BMP family ABC transporter substrate-binding protein [Heliobacterium chlorum]MBC9786049.1 BMP family ABC transporter substrate-binding protein [Heliobacterium chlorum]